MDWTRLTEKPAVGSLIKWKEPIWAPLGRNKRGKPEKIGEQSVMGEVTYVSRDFVEVMVIKAEKLSARNSNPLTVKAGDHIRRKRSSVEDLGDGMIAENENWPELLEQELGA